MNSDERERLKQIREDRAIWAGMGKAAEYLDFLLSLLDSNANGTPLCLVHKALDEHDDLVLEIGNDCVACSLNERSNCESLWLQSALTTIREEARRAAFDEAADECHGLQVGHGEWKELQRTWESKSKREVWNEAVCTCAKEIGRVAALEAAEKGETSEGIQS